MVTKRRDGVETRRRILDAAGLVFAEKGFHEAKVAEICRIANANAAAVNYHFGGKEKLYVEAWRYVFERSINLYPPDGGVPASASAEARLRGQIQSIVRRIMDPGTLDFDIARHEMTEPTGLLSEVIWQCIEPLRQRTLALVREMLGPTAIEDRVVLCEMSILAQCFEPLKREHRRREQEERGEKRVLPPLEMSIDVLTDHIFRFSLAGIRAERERAEREA